MNMSSGILKQRVPEFVRSYCRFIKSAQITGTQSASPSLALHVVLLYPKMPKKEVAVEEGVEDKH